MSCWGGGFFLGGSAESDYNLPGSVFDKEYRCTFDLLKSIPSARSPSVSVTDDFFAFNTSEPNHDRAHIFDRNLLRVHGSASAWPTASVSHGSR
jgi:oleate hydratase